MDQTPDSETADNGDDESHTEHAHDLDLLLPRHLQPRQHRKWQRQNRQVKSNLNATSDEAEQSDVNGTLALRLTVPACPKESDGPALEDHGKRITKTEGDDKTHEDIDDSVLSRVCHDSKIEGQDG